MAISETAGSATIGTTEFYCMSNSTTKVDQTADGVYQAVFGLGAMAAGDQFQLTAYEKVNAGTQGIVLQAVVTGAQAQPQYIMPALILVDGWEFSIKKLAGTDRSITFSIRKVA